MSIRSRRSWLKAIAGAVACAAVGWAFAGSASAADAPKKVLFLTKSSGFEHSVIARKNGQPAHLEKILTEVGPKHGYEITTTKDASLFNDPATYEKYDVFMYYTTGDLTRDSKDGGKGMTPEGKAAMMKAIEDGKGVVGIHSATDMFSAKKRYPVRPAVVPPGEIDPFLIMMGGQFSGHGSQQKAKMKVVSKFPGLENLKDYEMVDEWYTNNNIAPDLHVILVQDTGSMGKNGQRERMYNVAPYPATWARMQGKGRVFYTSMGHREDVCLNETFQQVLFAGLDWACGRTQFDPKPNMAETCPIDAPVPPPAQ